jgi:hypothetical protein
MKTSVKYLKVSSFSASDFFIFGGSRVKACGVGCYRIFTAVFLK